MYQLEETAVGEQEGVLTTTERLTTRSRSGRFQVELDRYAIRRPEAHRLLDLKRQTFGFLEV